MNVELEAKRRTTINALKASDNLRIIMENSGEGTSDNSEYTRVVDIRANYIVKLILLYYPYNIENDLISIKIDGQSFAIPLKVFEDAADKDVFEKIIDNSYLDPSDADSVKEQVAIDMVVDENNVARHISTQEYAFIGVTPGCGTTHTALMYAKLLSNIGKTAYVELNDSLDICALGEESSEKGKIILDDAQSLDAYFGYDYKDFIRSFRDLYAYVVLDFGFLDEEEIVDDYVRAQKRFIVSSSAKWSISRILEFEENPSFNLTSCIYVFPNANKENVAYLQSVLGDRKIIEVPFSPNPLVLTDATIEALTKNTKYSSTDLKPQCTCKTSVIKPKSINTNPFKKLLSIKR